MSRQPPPPTDISTQEAIDVERTRLSALFASHIGTLEQRIWALTKVNSVLKGIGVTLISIFILLLLLFANHQLSTNQLIDVRLDQLEQRQ